MIVSHAKKFIFIHNPKCAGTSFRNAIKRYHDDPREFLWEEHSYFFQRIINNGHLRLFEMLIMYPDLYYKVLNREYRSIVFMRNPVERFMSSIAEFYRSYRKEINFETLNFEEQLKHIFWFIDYDINFLKVLADHNYTHFTPQHWFSHIGEQQVIPHLIPMTGPFAEIASCILEISSEMIAYKDNYTKINLKPFYETKKIQEFVRYFYAKDYELFSKQEHLKRLV